MFKLGAYLKKYLKLLITGPTLKFFETLTDIVTPFLVAKMIDVGVETGNSGYVIRTGLIVIAINLLGLVLAALSQKICALTSSGIARDIRGDMFKHINTYSHAEYDKFSTMSLTNRTVHDVEQVKNAVNQTIRNVTRAPFLFIGSIIMACLIDSTLSLIFVIVSPIIVGVVYLIMKRTTPLYVETKTCLDNVSNVTRENLSGVRVVRAFNKQQNEKRRFDNSNTALLSTNLKVGNIAAIMQPIVSVLINFAIVAIIWFGGVRVNIGKLTQGQVIAFINYFGQISSALIVLARMLLVYTRTGASIKRINEVFEVKNSIIERKNTAEIDFSAGAKIEFKNVSFSYATTKNVVNNLSFTLLPGESLGIIGGTGTGKSSIINLIPRFYDATAGEVLINDVNVKKLNLKQLRDEIGIVPQKSVLFKGTLAQNLRWRKEFATDEELIKALKIAQAFEFVKEYPEFLNVKVERGGTNFSGGQKQRLTIARALVGKPKILILDDSSSALDFATDAALRKAIYRSLKDTTTIIVSQRTNSIKNCDKIIVLENAKAVDIGTHEQLLSRCDVYKEIYASQNKEKGE